MLCHVVQLRKNGNWLPRSRVAGQPGFVGYLDYRRADPAYWGRTMQARLLNIKSLEADVLLPLQYARILAIKEGGIMIAGYEITARGAKSKSIKTIQTWWCVVEMEAGYAAMERHAPRSSSGFDVNDDDMAD